jgi:hypothetical protein
MKNIYIFITLFITVYGSRSKSLLSIHEENWEKLLKGEWMVEL